MTNTPSFLLSVFIGAGCILLASDAYPQVSVSGSHADRSQIHWPGEDDDLINAGSPDLLSVSPDPSGQQAAVTNGGTDATAGGTFMYNDVASYSLTYTFDTAIHTLGYDLTSIDTYAGWTKWRVNQIYDVTYTTVASSVPVPLSSVSYLPIFDGSPSLANMSTRVHITNPNGVLAYGVKTITFTFKGDTTQPATGVSHVGAIYREIDVKGYPSQPVVSRTIMSGGVSDYVIATPDFPTASVTTAAAQLQYYLQQVGGCSLPIANASSIPPTTPRILVGRGPHVDALLPGMDWSPLEPDGFLVQTAGNDIILAGGGDRGTLYAVFDFLERQIGCRWWTSTEMDMPTATTIVVPNLSLREMPAFQYRSHFSCDATADPVFATIMRQNGTHQGQGAAWGGHHKIMGSGHTHFLLVPPEEHFAAHPEWYTDPVTGQPCTSSSPMPTAENSQLNLSAPGLATEVAAAANAWIAAEPLADYISINENDNGNYCQCSPCVALRASEGSQAGPNLHFVNQVAAIIHATHPGFKVETLAYRDNINPPATITPAPDVIVRFAPLQSDFGHPFNSDWNGGTPPGSLTGSYQENAYNNLPAWADISDELLVWNYVANFTYTMLPYPNIHLLGDDHRFFAQNKVTGVFQQGDNYTGGVGDFVQLRGWVISKLMWNPLINEDVYIDEFLSGYYGAAGPYLRAYIDCVRASYLGAERELLADEAYFSYMDLATMNSGKSLFDQAEAAVAGDAILLDRVRRERISFDLMWLYRYNPLRQAANFISQPFEGPSSPLTALQSISAAAAGFGVDQFQENDNHTSLFTGKEVPRLQAKLQANLTADQTTALPASILALIPSGTERENLIVLHPHDLKIRGSHFGDVILDGSPSDYAVRIRGDLFEWGPQYDMCQYEKFFYNEDDWSMYVEVRVDSGLSTAGGSLEIGVYDIPQYLLGVTGNVFYRSVPFATLSNGQYHIVPVSSTPKKIPHTSVLWMGGGNAAIPYIYVKRIFFVRS